MEELENTRWYLFENTASRGSTDLDIDYSFEKERLLLSIMQSGVFNEWPEPILPDVACQVPTFADHNILSLSTLEENGFAAAIYPTKNCGENVHLVGWVVMEDCGDGMFRFPCYNAGEPEPEDAA